jgi:hypothetical protein
MTEPWKWANEYPNYIVIPTKYVNYLYSIVENLNAADVFDHLFIFDNGVSDKEKLSGILELDTFESRIAILDTPDLSIYQMWNKGWLLSAEDALNQGQDRFNIAFLNDDIYFAPGTVDILGNFLRNDDSLGVVCPDYHKSVDRDFDKLELEYTHGTAGQGGISGFAFMVKGEIPVSFDENLTWWYGDDALFLDIENLGYKLGKVKGLPLEHAGSLSARRHPEIEEVIAKDMAYFNKKYGEARTRW